MTTAVALLRLAGPASVEAGFLDEGRPVERWATLHELLRSRIDGVNNVDEVLANPVVLRRAEGLPGPPTAVMARLVVAGWPGLAGMEQTEPERDEPALLWLRFIRLLLPRLRGLPCTQKLLLIRGGGAGFMKALSSGAERG